MRNYNCTFLMMLLFFFHLHPLPSSGEPSSPPPVSVLRPRANETQLLTYIIHIMRSEYDEFFDDDEINNWYQSFLPNATLDGGEPRIVFSFRHAFSGFAAKLTADEALAVESLAGVLAARQTQQLKLCTTYTHSFLGLRPSEGFWLDSGMGHGVVIGVVDTGVTPRHPSFKDDGAMPPPPAKWSGRCSFHRTVMCSNKIIGAVAFRGWRRASPKDSKKDGHGTHAAGIAAGAFVDGANALGLANGTAAGVAPGAHLAIYKACTNARCDEGDVLAAINQAIQDGVDVLSLSFGSNPGPLYDSYPAIAALSAVRKGIFVCMPAGNSGPEPSSVENSAPWVLTVGASSNDRRARITVKLGNGMELDGESGYQPNPSNDTMLPLAFPWFESLNGSLDCMKDSFGDIDIKDKIVLCVVGEGKHIEMGVHVKNAGGAGMIVVNTFVEGATTFSDDHVLPAAHLNYTETRKLVNYFVTNPNPTATIVSGGTVFGATPAPTVSYFSSRGPSLVNGGILKPDIIGPGTNVLSAWPTLPGPGPDDGRSSSRFKFLSGTSMATSHLAGVVALIKNRHTTWSPAMIKSAIMTTADMYDLDRRPITDDYSDKQDPAGLFAMGSGQVNPSVANDPGLVYDIRPRHYIQYLCGLGYSNEQVSIVAARGIQCSKIGNIPVEQLNYPSISVSLEPSANKTVTRMLTNVGDANEVYKIEVEEINGVDVFVSPSALVFSRINQKLRLSIVFSSNGVPLSKGTVLVGQLKLDSGKHFVRSPISITIS